MNTITRQQRTEAGLAKAAAARAEIVAALTAAEASVEDKGLYLVVNGQRVPFEVGLEYSGGALYSSPNGKVRAKLGAHGDVRQFPEGKTGLNVAKIVEAIGAYARAELAAARRRAERDGREAAGLQVAARINETASATSTARAVARKGTGQLAVLVDMDVEEWQATAILAAIRAIVGAGK